MANPVTDGLNLWQPDANASDQNLPQGGTSIGIGTAGDLSGELRRVKSELRAESIMKSWERWLGMRNLADNAFIVFAFTGATTFTVNDNLLHASRNVAVVGRRVKAILAGGNIYGTITASTFVSPTTTVTVAWDSGTLDGTLSEIQFGPELRAVQDGLITGSTLDGAINNTAALSSLYALTIPKNTLGATGIIHGEMVAFFNGLLDGSSMAFYFQYAGKVMTPFPTIHLTNNTGSTQGFFAVRFTFRLSARAGSSTQQTFILTAGITAELPLLCWNTYANVWTIHRVDLLTEDSTFDQPFNVSANFSLADVTNSMAGVGIDLWRGKR